MGIHVKRGYFITVCVCVYNTRRNIIITKKKVFEVTKDFLNLLFEDFQLMTNYI